MSDDVELTPQEMQVLAGVALALARQLPPDSPLRRKLLIEAKAVLDDAARLRDELVHAA